MILTHLVMFKFLSGAGEGAAPVTPTFNNATMNWLSPTPHLLLVLGLSLWALQRVIP